MGAWLKEIQFSFLNQNRIDRKQYWQNFHLLQSSSLLFRSAMSGSNFMAHSLMDENADGSVPTQNGENGDHSEIRKSKRN